MNEQTELKNGELKINDDQLLLSSGKLITFNNEQIDGLNKIKKWLTEDSDIFFTLAGYAGTGKSTMIKKILEFYRRGVVVSAPTHKAKKVIMNITGKEGQTLHGLLGLRPDIDLDNFNPNDPKFNPIAIPKITDYNLVIIDEASMINKELYSLIIEKTKNTRIKILFMGDPAQIPPVGEKQSVVFYDDTIKSHWLTKIERQTDTNPLTFIYDTLRNNLDDIDGGIKRITNINHLDEGIIFTINKEEFRKMIIKKLKSTEYQNNSDYVKVIAWRNQTVMLSNYVIRTELFGENTDIIELGDILMGYRSVSDTKQRYNIIENSADYIVTEKSKLFENKYGILGFNIKIKEEILNGQFKYQTIFIIDHKNNDNLHNYAEQHDHFRNKAKINKKLWKDYYTFRRNNLLMITIDKFKNGMHRDSYDIIVKDLDYGYAITGHKSQGSTYSHVFIMENDINLNWHLKERNQIKYVALTRPTLTATILTTKLYL